MSTSPPPQPAVSSSSLRIYDIELQHEAIKVKRAELHIGSQRYKLRRQEGRLGILRKEFTPALEPPLPEHFFVSVIYNKLFYDKLPSWARKPDENISFDPQEILRSMQGEGGRRALEKVHNNLKVVLGVSPQHPADDQHNPSPAGTQKLTPTTEEILRICPRFRILVIGKTGVGKSSLIHRAFGVANAVTWMAPSHNQRGICDIETELFSPQNDRFVLHDSKGFEPSEDETYTVVKEFVQHRRKQRDLKDQLHAVWLCLPIPRAGTRLLEIAVEHFLHSKSETLGNVPLIVVFTKYDELLNIIEADVQKSSPDIDDDAFQMQVETTAKSLVQTRCIEPIQQVADGTIPHAIVSLLDLAEPDHEGTLKELVKLTFEHVSEHVAKEASTVTAMAQRVYPELKIRESIAVGKKSSVSPRYWKALASSPNFEGYTIWDCLYVIHSDIVSVWNFDDPTCYLSSEEFRKLVVNGVEGLHVRTASDPNKALMASVPLIASIAGTVGALAGPAALIVLPIAVSVALAKWAYDVYKQSFVVQQRFMAYIVDLTHILEMLFVIVGGSRKRLTRRAIKLALAAYLESEIKAQAYDKIRKYHDTPHNPVLQTIESLIMTQQSDRAGSTDLRGYQNQVQSAGPLDQDEEWGVCIR
ncbi:hypothetical protein M405DRAFT_836649 [Rhizopogon salebrosus TDB-379]|nr:hypothetical protein M405DRAFT_836649 [Rhizopogon salebrosus TDB-379]